MGKRVIKGLFCFDGPLYKDKNGIYCNITLTDEMFSRYFSVVDDLIIVVRTFNSNKSYQELNMKPLTMKNAKVIEIENLNTIKGFIFNRKIFENNVKQYVEEADLIFARMPSNIYNFILKIAQDLKKPYLVENGGCAWDSYWNHGLIGKLIAPLMYYYEYKYVKGATFATYVTKQFLQNRYPNDNVTTNCSNVYLKTIDDEILKQRIEKIHAMNMKKIIVGQAVNSIDVKYKGEHFVLKAMKTLKQKGYDIQYQIVGPGKGTFLKKVASKLNVENQLQLLGTFKKDEMIEWYKNLDIYIQPSKQEGLPRSVIEAMSVGCPCLGSDIAGIPELLDKNCLFNPNHNREIVRSIMNILNDENLITQAKKNFERSKAYTIEDIELRRKKIFEQYKDFVIKKGVNEND